MGVVGKYHTVRCNNQISYVDVVLADHGIYEVVGLYHMCDHTYYIHMVLADHGKYKVAGLYHRCDHPYYLPMVPANYDSIRWLASTMCVITQAMQLWYRPTILYYHGQLVPCV